MCYILTRKPSVETKFKYNMYNIILYFTGKSQLFFFIRAGGTELNVL